MKKILMICTSLFAGLFFNSIFAAESLDKIIAIVNSQVITQSELNNEISKIKAQMAGQNVPMPPDDVFNKQVLDQLVNRKIQLQLADMSGIKIDDEKVSKAIAHIAEQNHLSSQDLLTQVKLHGLSVSDYKKEIHDEIVLQSLQQREVGSKVVITEQEVNDFMRSKAYQSSNNKEYHLEDILIALPESPSASQILEAKHHAELLLEKLHHGLAFSQAAMSESSGNKALQGGDLGWRKLAEIPSAFSEQIMNSHVNEIVGPIQTPNGFHLVRLSGMRDTGNSIAATTEQVHALLYQRKMEEGLQAWLTKIRSAAFINMHPDA